METVCSQSVSDICPDRRRRQIICVCDEVEFPVSMAAFNVLPNSGGASLLSFASECRRTQRGADSSVKWIRPLGYVERLMTKAHEVGGCMTTLYALWLESKLPIAYGHIEKTSLCVAKKMPHLRLALGHHKGDMWWREMPFTVVDIESITTDDVAGTFESLLKRRYRMEEGPLWFVRFVKMREDQEQVRDKNFNLKYKYVCIFGFLHNVSDGTTNMKFCNIFLSVLNDIVQGKEIDLKVEGVFIEPMHDGIADAITSKHWLIYTFLIGFFKGILSYGAFVHNFTRHFKMPAKNAPVTQVLCYNLRAITTERLINRCKMESVTMNSAFTAAANISMFKLIKKSNNLLQKTNINSVHVLNMRRYWQDKLHKNSLGCHISMLDTVISVHQQDLSNFWEYARKINRIMSYELFVTQRGLKVVPIAEQLKLIINLNYLFSQLGMPSLNDKHFCVTNMGDVTNTFDGNGPVIEATKLLRSVSCQFLPSLCQHTLQTFRGQLFYSIDYYSQKMSKETAKVYAETIIETITKAIHTPN